MNNFRVQNYHSRLRDSYMKTQGNGGIIISEHKHRRAVG